MSHSHIAICQETIFFLVIGCFPLFWLIRNVVAIRFSHRQQCLIATSFNILPSVPLLFLRILLHLIQIFVFIIPQYWKDDFITKRKQFIQTVLFFWFFLSHIAINILTCLPWWPSHSPDMHLSYQGCFCFKYFDIFLRGSYTVNMLLKTSWFWTFWTF